MFDNNLQRLVSLDCKHHVRYLGVLTDKQLRWKRLIDFIALKISKTIGAISRLRHSVPFSVLNSLISILNIRPYLSYGIVTWGRAAKSQISKLLILQKRALRLMYFAQRQQAVTLFLVSGFLPINMIYFEKTTSLMYDVPP